MAHGDATYLLPVKMSTSESCSMTHPTREHERLLWFLVSAWTVLSGTRGPGIDSCRGKYIVSTAAHRGRNKLRRRRASMMHTHRKCRDKDKQRHHISIIKSYWEHICLLFTPSKKSRWPRPHSIHFTIETNKYTSFVNCLNIATRCRLMINTMIYVYGNRHLVAVHCL